MASRLSFPEIQPHDKSMPVDQSSLEALRNIISQLDLLISTTTPLPENRTARCLELLRAATALTNDLLIHAPISAFEPMAKKSPTATRSSYKTSKRKES
jgi:hypothetical protein